MLFSIIVVSLNPGEKLALTLKSIARQTFKDYEVIIKDGLSTDGSLEKISDIALSDLKIFKEKDSGIYDAMNQGFSHSEGDYIYYLNCGDYFASDDVLDIIASKIKAPSGKAKDEKPRIIYGNIFERTTKTHVTSNPKIDGFACYRNVPCHQACFYERSLIKAHPFDTSYKVRADYEQFLWCYYRAGASMIYLDKNIADYEGDGYSESAKGLKISNEEHQKITALYMSKSEIIKYKTILNITLVPLRRAMAKNKKTAALYNTLKGFLYRSNK